LDYPGAPILGPVPLGRVHDDNAAGLNGTAGHAGLFGSALDLWQIVTHWAGVWGGTEGLFDKKTLETFLTPRPAPEGALRALGFDMGTGPWVGFFGHWGYTGSGLFWDPQKDQAAVFLTNRVHPTARNRKILHFRPKMATILRSFDS
jgi:CubicO group peptidase (beta-lactamase class C family)